MGVCVNREGCEMSHKIFKRILAISLSTALLAGAAGCKKKENAPSGVQNSAGSQPVGPSTPDGSPHGNYVLETDPYFTDTSLKLVLPKKPGMDEDNEAGSYIGLITDQLVVEPYYFGTPLTEEEKKEQDGLDVFSQSDLRRYYELLYKPSRCGIAVYSPSGEMKADLEFDMYYTEVRRIFPLYSGGFGVITTFEDIEEAVSGGKGHTQRIRLYNEEAEFTGEYILPMEVEGNILNYSILSLEDGSFLAYGEGMVIHLDQNWKFLKAAELHSQGESMIYFQGGKYYEVIFTAIWNEDGYTKDFKYMEMNLSDLSFSEEKPLSPSFPFGYSIFPNNGELYAYDEYGICKLDIPSGSLEYLLYWFDVDVNSSEIQNIKVMPSGDIYFSYGSSLVTLHKEAVNPFAGRRLIYVAVKDLDPSYMTLINEYNKRSDSKGRIVLYTPSSGVDDSVYSRAAEADSADRLLLDMKSGTGPDILINYSEFSQFDKDDILVDLNTYLDGDTGIDRSLYFDNIFRAFEVDGKLYQLPLTVFIDMLSGNPDYVSGISDWTLDDFEKKMQSLPQEVKPILYTSPNQEDGLEPIGILLNLLYRDMTHYVDYSRGEVRFDSDDFRKLMKIAKEIAPGISQETIYEMFEELGEDDYHEPKYIVMQGGLCALTTSNCRHLHDFASVADTCHSQVEFIGWPTTSGKGVAGRAVMSVGISAFSDEEARAVSWDFIRFLLSDNAQDTLAESTEIGFSVCRKSLNLSLQHQIDKNANRNPDAGASPKTDQETADKLIAIMERISTRVIENPTIITIIREEAPAYFDGSKSAEEVSRIIQDRATTLMAETA